MENNAKCVCGHYCGLTPEEKINIYLDSIFGQESKQKLVDPIPEQIPTIKNGAYLHYNVLRIIFGMPGIKYE